HAIVFGDKKLTIRSTDPDDPDVVAATVVDGEQAASVFRFDSDGATITIDGLSVVNGHGTHGGGTGS
ncbi:MAG: hypothetical protein ACP5KN_18390, partial [Armatimonadota bacterium]